ncbi:MAG: citT [Paenibacillaceae bacterium]|jgi:anion transporter|nr:citT [Paenibacillaceae bacterium]
MSERKRMIGIVLAAVALITIMALPAPEGLPQAGMRCLALFTSVFILYLFESVSAAIVSLLIVPLLVILRITNIKEALSGFSSTSTYLIIGSFILAEAVIQSKLGTRITYLILLKLGTSVRRISFGMMLVTIVLAFMIPSSTARTAMMLPICINIIRRFPATEGKSRLGTNIIMTLGVTTSTISAGILTSTISNPMAVDYIFSQTGRMVSYTNWLLWGFPPALLMTVVAWLLIQLLFPPEHKYMEGGREFIREELDKMGPVSRDEKVSLAVFALTVLLWVLGEKLGLDSTAACLLGACILCLPRIGVLKWETCKDSISLSVVFICSGGISLGAAMSSTGAAGWIAEHTFAALHLSSLPVWALIICIIVVVQFMHVMFVGTATMANVFFPVLVGIASVSSIPVEQVILPAAMMIGGYPVLTFFNTTPSILCYDTGYVTARDFPKLGLIISVIACAVYALCVLWYWPLTGLM